MNDIDTTALLQVKAAAELLFDQQQISMAVDRMAAAISDDVREADPLLLCVMNGGLPLTAELLARLDFPLRLDYVHVSRYHDRNHGTALKWRQSPSFSLRGQTVLIIDDILDQGYTLQALQDYCRQQGASRVLSAVMVDKQYPRDIDVRAEYVGVTAPNRYLFGFGMDYLGYWRNDRRIYAVSEATD